MKDRRAVSTSHLSAFHLHTARFLLFFRQLVSVTRLDSQAQGARGANLPELALARQVSNLPHGRRANREDRSVAYFSSWLLE